MSKAYHSKPNIYLILFVVIAVMILLILSDSRSFEDTYDAYIEASMNCDAEAVVDLLYDSYISDLIEKGRIDNKADLIRRVQNKLDWYSQHAAQRGGNSYKYVADLQSVKDEEINDMLPIALSSICEGFQNKLKEAKRVYIFYNLYTDDNGVGMEIERTITNDLIYFIKIGQKWYLGEISEYDDFNW